MSEVGEVEFHLLEDEDGAPYMPEVRLCDQCIEAASVLADLIAEHHRRGVEAAFLSVLAVAVEDGDDATYWVEQARNRLGDQS